MIVRISSFLSIMGLFIIILVLAGCSKTPDLKPCECDECVECSSVLPQTRDDYLDINCVPIEEVNNIIDTSNKLVDYVNEYDDVAIENPIIKFNHYENSNEVLI